MAGHPPYPSPGSSYAESFKRMVVREFEQGTLNKKQLSRKYRLKGHCTILKWCRKYSNLHYPHRNGVIGRPMKDPQKQRIKELEKALQDERLKVIAWEKLYEVIKREDGIDLLKKDVAKQFPNLLRNISGK